MTQSPRSFSEKDSPGAATGLPGPDQGVVDQAQQKAAQVVDQAQGVAGQVAEQAKQQATSQLASQKNRAVDGLVTVAQALRQTGQTLQQQEQGTVAGYVEEAAQRVDSVTNYLRTHEVHELVQDTQDLARRQPALFLTGALVLGFIGARFLMSSGQRAQTQRGARTSSYYGSGVGGPGAPDAPAYGGYAAPRYSQLDSPRVPAGSAGSPTYPVTGPRQAETPSTKPGIGGGPEA
jgi:hypothetical protein